MLYFPNERPDQSLSCPSAADSASTKRLLRFRCARLLAQPTLEPELFLLQSNIANAWAGLSSFNNRVLMCSCTCVTAVIVEHQSLWRTPGALHMKIPLIVVRRVAHYLNQQTRVIVPARLDAIKAIPSGSCRPGITVQAGRSQSATHRCRET